MPLSRLPPVIPKGFALAALPNEIDSDRGSLALLAAPAPLAIDFVAPLATPVSPIGQGLQQLLQPKTKGNRRPS